MDIHEVETNNRSYNTDTCVVSRCQIPKYLGDIEPTLDHGYVDDDKYFRPPDFAIGQTIEICKRRILIYDADRTTKTFYENSGVKDFAHDHESIKRPTVSLKVDDFKATLSRSFTKIYSVKFSNYCQCQERLR